MDRTDNSLQGRIALVTGGAGAGIGGAIVSRLRRAGATLIVTDISAKRLEALRTSFGSEATHHHFEQVDASDEAGVDALFQGIGKRFQGLDILVNGAGINIGGPIYELDLATWRKVIDVSLTSQFLHLRRAWPLMINRGGGSVVNISSIAAWSATSIGETPYAAAKAGVLGFTRAAAVEGAGAQIRVNAVAPGLIWSKHLATGTSEAHIEAYTKKSMLGRPGEPSDVAEAVHFLASDASRYMTGETITVAGGHIVHH